MLGAWTASSATWIVSPRSSPRSSSPANFRKTVEHLDDLVARIAQGEGTIGKLISDPELYDSLEKASDNLAALLADVKQYPGRYVHLSLFGRNPEKMKERADKKAAKAAAKAERDSLRRLQYACYNPNIKYDYPANFEQKIGFDRLREQVAALCTMRAPAGSSPKRLSRPRRARSGGGWNLPTRCACCSTWSTIFPAGNIPTSTMSLPNCVSKGRSSTWGRW